eukprot:jgi/Undpi1/14034/HiC_scaffold_9.g03685.m1
MIALKEVTVSNDADRRAVRTEMRALHTQRSPLLTSTFTTELASCPRIVEYYGSVVQENGNACIAVEYVAGGSLDSWLDSGCLCPEAWIAHIAHQALEDGDLKLGDFGAAGVENSSRMVGTQRFMAPERLKGRRATAQSDLWSLGLSLATAALGDNFISQASNQFEQLDLAGSARRTLAKATTLSADLTDFLHQCLSRDPARRPALRELMKHPFLERRHHWQSKCPEVALALRDRNRRQREEASVALRPDDVIDALCRVRAEVNAVSTRVDPSMAADLAYELGISAQKLVRNVGGGSEAEEGGYGGGGGRGMGGGGGGGGGASAGGAGRRRRSRPLSSSDGSLSPLRSLGADPSSYGRRSSGRYQSKDMAPMATVGGSRDSAYPPLSTPRNRAIGGWSGATATTGRATPYGGGAPSSCSRRGRRRALEVPSSVKLTPNKRRGERKSQTKRNGSSSACCEQDGARRTRGRRERERGLASRTGKRGAIPPGVAGAGAGPGAAAPSGRRHRSTKDVTAVGSESNDCCCGAEGGGEESCHRSMRGVFQIADEMKAEISVRDRVHRLRVYPNCFSGREAVQWMLDGCHASSVMEAEKLGNEMMKHSVFQHIRNSHVFEDSSVYYQFTDGETPPPPARGGRRLRQIARVFGGHVARKLVYNGIVGGGSAGGDAGGSGSSGGGSDSRARSPSGARKGKTRASTHCTADRCVCGAKQRSPRESGSTAATSTADNSAAGSTKGSTSSFSTFRQPLGGAGKASKGKPPRLPAAGSTDRSRKHGRRRNASGASESQLRRFSSSMSTATVPETPY